MPIVGLNVMSVITLAVDTAMCGRLVDAENALTALGFATQLVFLLMVAILGLTVGTVAFVARAWGAQETDRINHVLQQSVQLTYIVSIIVAVLGNAGAGVAMEWLGADPTVRDLGVGYLRPLFGFSVFLYLNMLFAAALRAVGNTKLPFMIALVSNALNVVLNYGFILGKLGLPELGVSGAAWGTVISQAVAVLMMVALLERDHVPGVRARLGLARLDHALARDLFRIGAPAALDMVVLNIAFLSIVGMLARVAQVTVAAHGIGLRIQSLAFVPGLGVAQAIGAMVGNALGASREAEAREVVRSGVLLSTGIMSVIGLSIVVGAEPIIAICTRMGDAGGRCEYRTHRHASWCRGDQYEPDDQRGRHGPRASATELVPRLRLGLGCVRNLGRASDFVPRSRLSWRHCVPAGQVGTLRRRHLVETHCVLGWSPLVSPP